MNVTMPYQAFRSQSRVEFIKKKFENSFSVENNSSSFKRNNAVVCKADCLQELKDLNLDNKNVNSKSEINDVNKHEGKALVKRSPAFRREKLGCAKTFTQVPLNETPELLDVGRKNLNDSAQETILNKTKVSDLKLWKDFKRSKTDTNLLKHCSDRVVDKKVSPKNLKNTEIINSLVQNRQSECDTEKKVLEQYSVVNKKINKLEKNEVINMTLSESIRKALQSPLPKGPPPKKPPRTFCHAQSFTPTSATSTGGPSAVAKSDIPKLKSKLEKLEKVIKFHETGTFEDKAKDNFHECIKKISTKADTRSVPNVTETSQLCLPVSQCLGQNTKMSNFKKLLKAKSEFYLAIDKADSNSMQPEKYPKSFVLFSTLGYNRTVNEKLREGIMQLVCSKSNFSRFHLTTQPGVANDPKQANISSFEKIYDLPCLDKKNHFETFGKSSSNLKDSVNAKKPEDLHYMCTDVINSKPKCPSFLSHIDWGRRAEEKILTDNSEFFPIEERNLSNTSVRDDMKKFENSTKEGTEKNKSHSFGEESSGESECDFMTLNSDCHEQKNKSEAEGNSLSRITAKRKIYVSSVSSKLMSQIPSWKYKNKNSYKHLFECCLLVGLSFCESKQSVPYIKSIFPPNTKPPPLIESLCFPDASYWPLTSENHLTEEQCHSLVVTNEHGERKFGYCRRVLPEGGHVCLPLAYCIISPHRAGGFFYKVLEELESRHGSPVVENFIKQLYESEFPGPGERLKLKEILEEATRTSQLDSDIYLSSTLVRRPPDVRLEEKDLTQLFKHLQLPVFLKVFSSLLLERKVLLLSSSLRNLSSCTEALHSTLLPFSWQHTYIPVLPVHLIEMCEAPTPYVIGLLKPKNVEQSFTNVNFEDGILVDLDDSKILKCCGDEGSILPSRLIRDLKTSLNLAMNSSDLLTESVRSVLISDAFIRFFVQACGNYSTFIQSLANGEKLFQKEEFIKSVSSDTTQSFLDWFTETAMFNSFIQERLQGDDEDMFVKLFKRRAMEYSDDSIKDSAVLLKNYRVINKKVKTLGGRIKDFTSFAK